ncbi:MULTISPECIES: hypothetical protein [unclassified Streptomyces]|uniref:hypothetical protein n=1 Tax=unclassified Streptomyces TaxID=2593676 RepID=UPI002DDBBE26|nr:MULTISPECIES: hypothetical protein [unclassified Streptomyces]WRZ22955.1 hypothetical protein OHT59_32970 [Streptomyces sp. NBC_00243]
MSDTSTMEWPTTDAQTEGHGKHRGPVVSGGDADATPQGRHRKPSDQGNKA